MRWAAVTSLSNSTRTRTRSLNRGNANLLCGHLHSTTRAVSLVSQGYQRHALSQHYLGPCSLEPLAFKLTSFLVDCLRGKTGKIGNTLPSQGIYHSSGMTRRLAFGKADGIMDVRPRGQSSESEFHSLKET
ncbi:hypothetical protein K443DRAFT_676478 [Laccaria amethystina LaAM-08-1]|uniref:Uncharacterized protein n=1 Tax=Laccaria amethystina LaAM-08-1 TaxID=1095629 RepID=A0A0C9Y1A5_9AGAR|nr:hypothetical protein K443DRAFT_676478 [Laccaria amethystina LaAM-08-1]